MGKNKKKGGNKRGDSPEPAKETKLSGLLDDLNIASDDEEENNKKGSRNKNKQDKVADPEPEPEVKKGGNKKNGQKKKRNKWANSDSEEDREEPPKVEEPIVKKGGKKNKKNNKKHAQSDDEDEQPSKKSGAEMADSDEEDEDKNVPVPVKNNNKNNKKQAKKNAKKQIESDDEEEEEPPKKGGFGAFADSDTEEEEEEEEEPTVPVPVKNNKKNNKKQAKKNAKKQIESDDEEEEEPPKMGGFGAFADSDNESAKPAADSDDENKMDEDERQENDNEKEKKKSDKKKDKKDKKSSSEIGLSSEQKKEFKKLKAKKEDGSLSKSDKARYKELKSLKKGGDGDNEEVSSPKKGDSSSSKVYGGVSDGKPVWPPPKAEVAPWPPVAATSTSATSEDASKEGEEGGGGEEATKTKVTKMSKLQMKMEAAKLKREAEAKAKEEEEAMIVQKAKEEAEAKKQALKKNTTTTESGSGSGAAAEEEQGTPSSTTMKQKSEDATKRVFNVEDDLVRDASVPCSASLLDTDIPEIDESKLTKKELKKAQRDRENLIRLKEAEQERVQRSLEGAQFSCSQTAFDERDPVWLNSLDISIPSITISAYNKNLFVDAPLTIAHGRHYGLVGPNGKGKSTLLKMIASGSLKIPPRIDALYVEQEVHADETPAFEAVLMADKVRWALIKEEREILAATAITHDEEKDTRLAAIYEELSAIDAASAEPKARRILFGLGFDSEMQNRPTREFSGGWRMRISLARALFIEPTFLMLDEPTNHLDLNAVIWLDDYLQRWKKTLLIVSHDQDFLNSTCEEILHLNNQKLDTYRGNYDTFKQLEVKKREQANKAWELEQKRIKQLKASGVTKSKANEQVKNKKNKEQGNDKKKKNAAVASGTDTADAKQLLVRSREYTVTLQFGDVQKLAPPVIQVMESTFRYQPHLPIIFDELNFGIDMDSRICVVGNNGSGKSTLIKMLVGEVEPTTGFIRRNPKLRVGIYNQHFVDKLPMASSPVEYLRNSFDDLDYQSARNLLGKFGLEGHAHEIAMRDLSGGQKARVTFCELTLSRPHVLFLDEPTNNLDIESIDALCEAINLYQGGMVVVTHDARLIEATESELWVVEDRKVIAWDGEFDSYREHLLKKLEQQMEDIN